MEPRVMERLEDELINKMSMESLKYEDMDLTYNHVDASMLGSLLDSLVVRNLPGHFPRLASRHSSQLGGLSEDSILNSLLDREVEIAVTPFGNADAPVDNLYFAQPFLTTQSVRHLLEKMQDPDRTEQYYFQSQNDNLDLLTQWGCPVPRKLPIMFTKDTKYLGEQQAANLWIGTKGTTSRLHNDNYDNIYIQVCGTKRIYLIPPGFAYEVKEKFLVPATYDSQMQLKVDGGSEPVVFPTFNPAKAQAERPSTMWVVDLRPGDLLFMPALWYHQVEILTDGINMSLNYWHTAFDDEKRWSEWNFTRQLALMLYEWKQGSSS